MIRMIIFKFKGNKFIIAFLVITTLGLFVFSQVQVYRKYRPEFFLFDSEFYYKRYPELQKAYSMTDFEKLRELWMDNMLIKGEVASPVYDPTYFIDNNPDIKAKWKNDYVYAFCYFSKRGISEGRESSPVFSINYYRKENKDLAGLTNMELIEHYVKYGIHEGRRAHPDFDVKSYLERYQDVKKICGNDYKAALIHYLTCGMKEGRNGKPFIKP